MFKYLLEGTDVTIAELSDWFLGFRMRLIIRLVW